MNPNKLCLVERHPFTPIHQSFSTPKYYTHLAWCDCDRCKPQGSSGCSCFKFYEGKIA